MHFIQTNAHILITHVQTEAFDFPKIFQHNLENKKNFSHFDKGLNSKWVCNWHHFAKRTLKYFFFQMKNTNFWKTHRLTSYANEKSICEEIIRYIICE